MQDNNWREKVKLLYSSMGRGECEFSNLSSFGFFISAFIKISWSSFFIYVAYILQK